MNKKICDMCLGKPAHNWYRHVFNTFMLGECAAERGMVCHFNPAGLSYEKLRSLLIAEMVHHDKISPVLFRPGQTLHQLMSI